MLKALRWFERRVNPFPGDGSQAPAKLVPFIWHFAKPQAGWIFVMAAFAAVIASIEVALVGFMGDLVDRLAASSPETFWSSHGLTIAGWMLLMVVGLPVLGFFSSLTLFQALQGNFPMQVRWRSHRWLLGQSLAFYNNEFAGRISTKLMQTSLAVRDVVMKLFDVLLYVSVYFLGAVYMLFSSDVRLGAPMFGWLLSYLAVLAFFVPRLGRAAEAQADARSKMTGRIVDSYTNIHTVKLFAHSERETDYAKDAMDGFLQTVYRQMRLVTGVEVSLYIVNGFLLFVVTLMSIYLWSESKIGLGIIAVSVSLVLRLHGMSHWILWEASSLFENLGTVADGMKTLAVPRTVVDRPQASKLNVEKGKVSFEKIRFHYGKTKGVIDDLSLTIEPGEKVGLVGRSGAGKSTMVNLLLRFYDLEGGRITIDGQNIAEVTQESLRSQIGMVTQDTSLLHRSVRDNIRYGRPEATEEEVEAAICMAKADAFIDGLEDQEGRKGLEAMVGERGVRLSGGQRQRIALARVFLKNARILVLDEATSALDSEVEAAIQDSLVQLMKGKTVVAIAHRLSTIAHMDRLVVVDQGAIIETGTHEQLLQSGGLYASLWSRQSGGFLAEQAPPKAS